MRGQSDLWSPLENARELNNNARALREELEQKHGSDPLNDTLARAIATQAEVRDRTEEWRKQAEVREESGNGNQELKIWRQEAEAHLSPEIRAELKQRRLANEQALKQRQAEADEERAARFPKRMEHVSREHRLAALQARSRKDTYVDAVDGKHSNDGLTPDTAKKLLSLRDK